MVKKSDWKTLEMPSVNEQFVLERTLSKEDMEMMKEGQLPQQMEDKWFMYCEENKLFIHRSWTGYCIYIVNVSSEGKLKVTVNRNLEQYKETNIERDKIKLNILINSLIRENGENAKLMKEYIKMHKK